MLADIDEPLVLADGRKIDKATGKVIDNPAAKRSSRYVEVPSGTEAQAIVVRTRKSVAELPLPPSQLNAVGLVAFYTLFGLPDVEISIATDNRLTIEQIKNIRNTDAYKEFMIAAKTNILETATDEVREKFASHARVAADRIIELAESENEVLAFKASQDVLDRAGHRPADIVEHRHKMEDALNIVITTRDGTNTVPVLDIVPDSVTVVGE